MAWLLPFHPVSFFKILRLKLYAPGNQNFYQFLWMLWEFMLCHYLFIFFWPHHAACWILVPWPGIKPVPPALEVRSLNHWTQGSPQEFMLWYRHSFSSLRLRCSTFPISFWRKHSYLSRLNWVSSSGVLPWSASFGEVTPPCALLLVCLLFHGTWLNVLKFSHYILVFLIRPVYLQGKSTFKVIFESPGFGEYSEMCSMTFTEINSNKC